MSFFSNAVPCPDPDPEALVSSPLITNLEAESLNVFNSLALLGNVDRFLKLMEAAMRLKSSVDLDIAESRAAKEFARESVGGMGLAGLVVSVGLVED